MKTPEEMAIDYIKNVEIARNPSIATTAFPQLQRCFLAGYNAAQQWISVKDRLPEINELCIVNTEWRGVVPATYGNESWIFDEGQGWSEKVLSYVTHWMPLPEAPKEEK